MLMLHDFRFPSRKAFFTFAACTECIPIPTHAPPTFLVLQVFLLSGTAASYWPINSSSGRADTFRENR
jgi:ABC-type glycerol-3-phosphate transport system permease component